MSIAGTEIDEATRGYRLTLLLVSIVVMLLLSPLIEGGTARQELIVVLTSLVLFAAVRVAAHRQINRTIALCLVGFWSGAVGIALLFKVSTLLIVADFLFAALCAFTTLAALRHVATAKKITLDVLCGAAAVYLLLGLTWAITYSLLETFSPGSLALPNPEVQSAWTQVLYFSFTTLTTVGYGDVLPVSAFARIWSNLEAVAGTFYMALLVARLVSLYRA